MIEINEDINEIVFLGPKGTYCEIAKDYFIDFVTKKNIKETALPTVKRIIEHVEKNPLSIGVVPIENSIEGIVRETMDNLLLVKDKSLQINAETIVAINHCLVSKSKNINNVKNIISHPQALAQCRNFIADTFDEVSEIEKSSTSKAAQELVDLDESYAAIANEKTAQLFNLNVLAKNINDEKDNKTRFVLISRSKTKSTNCDKTSIAFATKNQSGALVKVLNVFDSLNINLLYIDSRPSKKNLGEYVFFVDFEGHIDDVPTQKVLDLIKLNTTFIKILGSYKKN